MNRRGNWMLKATRLIPLLDPQRCIDELFDCGLLTFGLPEGL